jgi:hypothetical protein
MVVMDRIESLKAKARLHVRRLRDEEYELGLVLSKLKRAWSGTGEFERFCTEELDPPISRNWGHQRARVSESFTREQVRKHGVHRLRLVLNAERHGQAERVRVMAMVEAGVSKTKIEQRNAPHDTYAAVLRLVRGLSRDDCARLLQVVAAQMGPGVRKALGMTEREFLKRLSA